MDGRVTKTQPESKYLVPDRMLAGDSRTDLAITAHMLGYAVNIEDRTGRDGYPR